MTISQEISCTVELRPRSELGATHAAGLRGTHHFCFASYQRPDRMEWGGLRCLNHYELDAGTVRAPTLHAGFDIVTLVTRGALRRIGAFAPSQIMASGSVELVATGAGVLLGIEAEGDNEAAFTEIWIAASPPHVEPRREWRPATPRGLGTPVASGMAATAANLRLGSRSEVCSVTLHAGQVAAIELETGACAYVAVARGMVGANGVQATVGDGLAATSPGRLSIEAVTASDLLIVRTRERRDLDFGRDREDHG